MTVSGRFSRGQQVDRSIRAATNAMSLAPEAVEVGVGTDPDSEEDVNERDWTKYNSHCR